jgi:opacity protein-like surface antigen
MRKLILAAALFGMAQGAQAADLPDLPILRGSLPDGYSARTVNWQGYYIGGQAGYGSTNAKFRPDSNNSLVTALIASVPVGADYTVPSTAFNQLGTGHAQQTGFGGFVGYNSQWDDVIVGIEGSYMHGDFSATSSWTAPPPPAGVNIAQTFSRATMTVNDYGTLRARAGYVAGSFLPYMFGGLALGRADVVREVGIVQTNSPSGALPPPNQISRLTDRFVYGYSAGLGVDVALVAGLFLRAEWEYARFIGPVDTSINTVRAGLGYKF